MSEQRNCFCGLYGARDGYEVPAALQQAGLLKMLLAVLHGHRGWMGKHRRSKTMRKYALLPRDKVRRSGMLLLANQFAGRVFAGPEDCNLWPDVFNRLTAAGSANRT